MTNDDTKGGELTMSLFDPRITAWHDRIARAVRHGWRWEYTQARVAVLYRLSHGRRYEIALEQ
jgi:hypothetical protein